MKSFLMLVILLFAGTLGLAVAVPDRFEIERAVSVDASPWKVFAQINDLRRWAKWTPWQEMDPDMKAIYSRAASGKGAFYEWSGNDDVGTGRIEITETKSPTRVRAKLYLERPFEVQNIKLDFVAPFDIDSTAELVIARRGGATVLTCTMKGKYSLADKMKALVARTDVALGHELDVGLANLKAIVES
jgi:hypothetical protein